MAAKVNWFGDVVKLQLANASAEMVRAAAMQTEAQAKINITNNGQVDTGFMRQSVHAQIGAESAIVAVGAEYGIYQEMDRPYLYPALERVASRFGGEIVAAGKGAIND